MNNIRQISSFLLTPLSGLWHDGLLVVNDRGHMSSGQEPSSRMDSLTSKLDFINGTSYLPRMKNDA